MFWLGIWIICPSEDMHCVSIRGLSFPYVSTVKIDWRSISNI
jgi:hypothetical protein